MRKLSVVLIGVLFLPIWVGAQQAPASKWSAWSEFIGTWQGAGGGQPGQGAGEFSLLPGLQGEVLVRRNYASYPAMKARPAFRHDDLTIIYKDGARTRADYWDSEGHVIHYAVRLSRDGRELEFVSDAVPGQPRYRLSYAKTGRDEMKITFAIAPPSAPTEFKTYVVAAARRKK